MAVISKKEQKVAEIVRALPDGFAVEQFVVAFQAAYPKDWDKLVRSYKQHERENHPGKPSSMPSPVQYLKNALNAFRVAQHDRHLGVVRGMAWDNIAKPKKQGKRMAKPEPSPKMLAASFSPPAGALLSFQGERPARSLVASCETAREGLGAGVTAVMADDQA